MCVMSSGSVICEMWIGKVVTRASHCPFQFIILKQKLRLHTCRTGITSANIAIAIVQLEAGDLSEAQKTQ